MEKIIIAQIKVHEAKVEQFKESAKILVEMSRQEKGCLSYRLLNEVDKPNEFIFYEKYINEKAIELHNTSEHLSLFLNTVSGLLLDKPIIDTYS